MPKRDSIPDEKKVQMADGNTIWLNAFSCVRPTDDFKIKLADMILSQLRDPSLLLRDIDAGIDVLYLSITKS